MSDLLKSGSAFLTAQLKAFASRDVTVTRGGVTITVKATVGTSLLKVASGSYGEMKVVRTERDYLIDAADYDFGAGAVEPAAGDRFGDAIDGRIFDCLSPAPGEDAWRYSDNTRTRLRVHVKDVGAL